MAPKNTYYKAVAKQLHEKHANSDRKVMVGKVDGSGDRALASRFNIRGFPSFFLIDGWTVREYTGTRSQEALIEFVMETYEDYEVSFLSMKFYRPCTFIFSHRLWRLTIFVYLYIIVSPIYFQMDSF